MLQQGTMSIPVTFIECFMQSVYFLPFVDRIDCDEQVSPLVERQVQLRAARRQLHQVERSLHFVPSACHLEQLLQLTG